MLPLFRHFCFPCARAVFILCVQFRTAHVSELYINHHLHCRFSLYDFPSDSESEEQRPTSSAKKDLKKVSSNPKPGGGQLGGQSPFKKQFTGSTTPQSGSAAKGANTSKKSFSPKISPKVKSNSNSEDQRQSPESNLGKWLFYFDPDTYIRIVFLTLSSFSSMCNEHEPHGTWPYF